MRVGGGIDGKVDVGIDGGIDVKSLAFYLVLSIAPPQFVLVAMLCLFSYSALCA